MVHTTEENFALQSQSEEEDGEDGQDDQTGGAEKADRAGGARQSDSVLNCLKRALKIAHASQQQLALARKSKDTTPVLLFVEILNKYLYFFEQDVPSITAEDIQVCHLPGRNGV